MAANRPDPVRGRPSEAVAATLPINRAQPDNAYGNQRNNPPSAFGTAPAALPAVRVPADEFGNIQRNLSQVANTAVLGAAQNTAPTLITPGRRSNSGGANPTPTTVPTPQQDALNEARRTPSAATAVPDLSAEEEKVQLFVKARERAAKVQGVAATPVNLLMILYLFGRLISSSCLAACKCYPASQSATRCFCGSAITPTTPA